MRTVLGLLRLLTIRFPPPGGHHAITYEAGEPEVLLIHLMMKDRSWQIFRIHEEDFDKSPEDLEKEICALLNYEHES